MLKNPKNRKKTQNNQKFLKKTKKLTLINRQIMQKMVEFIEKKSEIGKFLKKNVKNVKKNIKTIEKNQHFEEKPQKFEKKNTKL